MNNKSMMLYDNQKKSVFLAYLLGAFLGWLGVHLFYTENYLAGAIRLVCGLLSPVLGIFTIIFGLLMLYDLFATYFVVKDYNNKLIEKFAD
jgi:TM2 domain-containing membrane protein YozV